MAMELIDSSIKTGDPLWQLPLWENYSSQLKSVHADFKNIGNSMFGGAITAALFLEKFVEKNIPWIHVDLMAWTRANKYHSYEGGEAMGIRALLDFIKNLKICRTKQFFCILIFWFRKQFFFVFKLNYFT